MKNGFTIIELIISIFVLSVGIVGVFSAFSIVVILTSNAADNLTATYLTQEGMEIVSNIRDSNWINMDIHPGLNSWLSGLDLAECVTTGCKADYKTTAITMSPFTPGDYLYQNSNGFYVYDQQNNSKKTKFQRKITIVPLADVDGNTDHIVMVKIEVSWDQKATILDSPGFSAGTCVPGKNCIAAEETLYDWY